MSKGISLLILLSKHFDDQRKCDLMLAQVDAAGFPRELHIDYASNPFTAQEQLATADWVLADLYTAYTGDAVTTLRNGIRFAEACLAAQKPIAVVRTFMEIDGGIQWATEHGVPWTDIADNDPVQYVSWREAFYRLIYAATGLERALLEIRDGRIIRNDETPLVMHDTDFIPYWQHGPTDLMRDPILQVMTDRGFPWK